MKSIRFTNGCACQKSVCRSRLFKLPDVQRLGYLLDLVEQDELANPLAIWLSKKRTRHVRLRARAKTKNLAAENRWRVDPNEAVEVDL